MRWLHGVFCPFCVSCTFGRRRLRALRADMASEWLGHRMGRGYDELGARGLVLWRLAIDRYYEIIPWRVRGGGAWRRRYTTAPQFLAKGLAQHIRSIATNRRGPSLICPRHGCKCLDDALVIRLHSRRHKHPPR